MQRVCQVLLIAATLLASWLGMQAVHELGHVAVAQCTGGHVKRVILHPLEISRTELGNNPYPLAVAWGGPLLGVGIPLVALLGLWALGWKGLFLARFFAGFCLIANGAYLGVGSFGRIGDAGDILRWGSARWTLWLFGVTCTVCGLWLWHGLGKWFGLGSDAQRLDWPLTLMTLAVALALLVLGLAIGR